MPRKLERVQNYPKPVKLATLFRANPVIILLQISSLTFNNLHYIVLGLWKVARPAQVKEKNRNFGIVIGLFVSYLFSDDDVCSGLKPTKYSNSSIKISHVLVSPSP
jgi:hypothetical protein